jgi:FtsH-binding integral membrane protein
MICLALFVPSNNLLNILTHHYIGVKQYMKTHSWLYWLAFAMTLTIIFFLFCFNLLVRKVPWNFIMLFLFTVFESYMVASICIFQDIEDVLIASVLTFAMFFGLTVFAFFVKLNNP